MYFQLEVDYYSNEVNKSKYKNFQLKASTKNNLKIAEEQIVQGVLLAMTTCHTLLLGLQSTLLLGLGVAWKYIFQVQVMFVGARYKSLYVYVNTIYVNKNRHSFITLAPSLSFIIHKCGGITLAWDHFSHLRINQIYIKIGKVKACVRYFLKTFDISSLKT